MKEIFLLDIFPGNIDLTDYCSHDFWKWENSIAIPMLSTMGYRILGPFYDGERDSCGPLSRIIKVEKDGIQYEAWYG